ncbi:MAG: hypothetical protein V3T86_07640, partial [Planctomycetota bacterium]
SSGDKSSGDKSSGDKSSGDKSGGNKSSGDKSSGDKSSGDKSSGDKSGGDKSSGDKSGGDKTDGTEDEARKEARLRARVLIRLHLDRQPYLTRDSRLHLIEKLSANADIYSWMKAVNGNQHVMDQLSRNLLQNYYAPLWESLRQLSKTERHSVKFRDLREPHYRRFLHWARPRAQQDIEIIELLPASRDDLVSMSINEGGVIAQAAFQAEAAGAYDFNSIKMLSRNLKQISETLNNQESGTQGATDAAEAAAALEGIQKSSEFSSLLKAARSSEAAQYGLGASGRASIYARAKAALAYSKRREYLDAVITAAGRGDNFAKWVVRKSDLRSDLAKPDGRKLVAAAHSGYPNGDQPFHMLVKVPLRAMVRDWDGHRYILFQSGYRAHRHWRLTQRLGPIIGYPTKIVSYVFPKHWRRKMESQVVGTVYPFLWDVENKDDQVKLLKEASKLGGRLRLDDTDKIRFSEIKMLLTAEQRFIEQTRSAQSADLSRVLGELEGESKKFREETSEHLAKQRNKLDTLIDEESKKLDERITKLEADLEKMREEQANEDDAAGGGDEPGVDPDASPPTPPATPAAGDNTGSTGS